MLAIFLVGGLGTRLRPFTCETPKALLPILNRPFISYQFDLLKRSPVKDVILAAGRGHRAWESSIRKVAGRRFNIHFAYEKELLGTGGAVRLAVDTFQKKTGKAVLSPTLVLNGDVFFEVDLIKLARFHATHRATGTIALTEVKDPSRFGLVIMDKRAHIQRFVEKPPFKLKKNYVNGGIYLLNREFIAAIPPNRVVSIERQSFPEAIAHGMSFIGYKSVGYWNDIGTPPTYKEAHKDLINKRTIWTEIKYLRKRGNASVYLSDTARVASSVKFEGFACVGHHVVIAEGATIRNSVLHDDVRIGKNAVVLDSILGRGVQVGNNAVVTDDSFVGPSSVLSPYSKI